MIRVVEIVRFHDEMSEWSEFLRIRLQEEHLMDIAVRQTCARQAIALSESETTFSTISMSAGVWASENPW